MRKIERKYTENCQDFCHFHCFFYFFFLFNVQMFFISIFFFSSIFRIFFRLLSAVFSVMRLASFSVAANLPLNSFERFSSLQKSDSSIRTFGADATRLASIEWVIFLVGVRLTKSLVFIYDERMRRRSRDHSLCDAIDNKQTQSQTRVSIARAIRNVRLADVCYVRPFAVSFADCRLYGSHTLAHWVSLPLFVVSERRINSTLVCFALFFYFQLFSEFSGVSTEWINRQKTWNRILKFGSQS